MYTLLVVDDEPNIVEGLSSQFEQRYADSVIVLKSYSGEHALSVIRNNKVDVILSDVRMPDVDGLELIRETEKLWPQARFVFLSGLDEFDYIHQASKSSIYRGYLLKMEGDEVVMEKVDSMIEQCAADQRAEDERGRMHAFVQRAALESALRGGGSWQDFTAQTTSFSLAIDTGRPVYLVLGKCLSGFGADGLKATERAAIMLASQAPGLVFESLLPEDGTLVWILQEREPGQTKGRRYIHALFGAIQQQLNDSYGLSVGMVVGDATPFDNMLEQYGRLINIYYLVARNTGRLVIVDESDYAGALLNKEKSVLQERFHFSVFSHKLDQQLRTGTPESTAELFAEYFHTPGGALLHPETMQSEQQLTLFTQILAFLRESDLGGDYDKMLAGMIDGFLHGDARMRSEAFVENLAMFCGDLCRRRAENEAHNTQTIVQRINRYIEDNIEDYNLSLTELARMTGFNPSYLSRLYRMHTGKKLSEQIDEVKLRHAQKLILSGAMIKNVAERTGFASPSAFILFFKRNTGRTPRQFFEEHQTVSSGGIEK